MSSMLKSVRVAWAKTPGDWATGPLEPEPEPLGPSAMQYIYIHIYIYRYINIYIYIYVVDAKELRVPGAWARVLAPRPRAWGFRQCKKPGLGFLKPCRLSPSPWSPRQCKIYIHNYICGRC